MFEMTNDELLYWRSQFASSNTEKMGLRYAPIQNPNQLTYSE